MGRDERGSGKDAMVGKTLGKEKGHYPLGLYAHSPRKWWSKNGEGIK